MTRFAESSERILELHREGFTLQAACEAAGTPVTTARKWLAAGRAGKAPYADWLARYEAPRTPVDDDDGRELGRVESTVEMLLADREPRLGPEQRLSAQEARCVARAIDELSKTKGGQAALGLVSASRRLDELITDLELPKEDAIDRLQAAYAARKNGSPASPPVSVTVAPPPRKKVASNGHAKHEIKSRDW
jgi:hypothetical protein